MKRILARLVLPRRVSRVATPAAIAASFVLLAPSAAFAAWEGVDYGYGVWGIGGESCAAANPGYFAGRGCFQKSGDQWTVLDASNDGLRVGVYWQTSNGRSGMCVNREGSGKIRECVPDYAESSTVTYRVGVCDGTVNPCGQPGSGAGWTGWSAWQSVGAS